MKGIGRFLKTFLESGCSIQITISQWKVVARLMAINREKDGVSPLMKKGAVLVKGVISQRNPVLSVLCRPKGFRVRVRVTCYN